MNDFGSRINGLISALGLKKAEFAQKIGVSQPYVSQLCSGVRLPSDRTIADICREFNVSETWLRTGEGEMFVRHDPPTDGLDAILDQYGLPRLLRGLFLRYSALPPEAQQAVEDEITRWVLETANEIQKRDTQVEAAEPMPMPAQREQTIEESARAEADRYYEKRVQEKRQALETSNSQESGENTA